MKQGRRYSCITDLKLQSEQSRLVEVEISCENNSNGTREVADRQYATSATASRDCMSLQYLQWQP